MDPRLLQHYNVELQHLREMGAEFAQQFPKIAARLGMSGLEVADPYVERLLEGVSFLAARVQLKLDAEFPRFTQALLEIVYPHYLVPTPSMLVAQLKPDTGDSNLATGVTVARNSPMRGNVAGDNTTACEFRTAHPVTLWPVEIASASYFSFAPDLPLNALPVAQRIKGGVRIHLKTTAGLTFRQTAIDRLCFYLTGHDETANKLYELCLAAGLGVLVRPARGASRPHEWLPASAIRPVGFTDDEALLPVTLRSFQGYRLLLEYFSFPQRYRFVELTGLSGAFARADTDEIEVVIPFARGEPSLERVLDASNVALFCTPAVNVFEKRADRIHVTDSWYQYHVVPDRTRPLDFEVYEVTEVAGHGAGTDAAQPFLPLYAAYGGGQPQQQSAYFTTRRQPRLISATENRHGPRSSYIGTEVFLGLVDSSQAPFSRDLRQLSVHTLCTNRDLVLHMPTGLGKSDLFLDIAAPVTSISVVGGPSRPRAALADGAVSWRAISHLSLNYLSLVNSTPHEGATALRELLELYASEADSSARKQIEGVRSVRVDRIVRRLPPEPERAGRRQTTHDPLAFGRGLEITLEVDELAFEGGSAYLLGSVLNHYFARYVSMNAVTETVLRSQSRGENHAMGATLGREADALAFFAELADAPYRYDFYQTMRRLECLHRDKPRWGRARRPVDEPVRLGQDPDLSFAPAPLAAFEAGHDGRPPRLDVRLFGLLGPNGPLPIHLTEYARERLRHANDPTFSRFLDLLNHRFLALFYRAWAQAQPQVNRDRPDEDRFAVYIGALVGVSSPAVLNRDTVPDLARLFHVGTLIRHVRNAEGLAAVLRHFFDVPVRIEEFVGHWLSLSDGERTCLRREGAALGRGAVLGRKVWDRQSKFRLHLGPLTLNQYESLLPGSPFLRQLVDWVRMYICFELDWDVRLRVKCAEVPRLALGGRCRLGWTTWLGERRSGADADDLCLDAEMLADSERVVA